MRREAAQTLFMVLQHREPARAERYRWANAETR
jgi:hypothetical protein